MTVEEEITAALDINRRHEDGRRYRYTELHADALVVLARAIDRITPVRRALGHVPAPILVSTDVRDVYEEWVTIMGKNPKTTKLTPERRRVIQARLKDGYGVGEMVNAIRGCFRSDFHMARGEYRGGTKFNDLTLILRNGSKLEGFRDGKPETDKGAFL